VVSDPNYRKGSEQNKYAEFLGNNELKYTYYWSVRYFHNNEWHNGIIAMSGSQLKVGRELQQAIKRLKTPSGKPAPIFAYAWDASSVFIEGEKGDFFGWQFRNPQALDPENDEELL
ncbi:hypothetical protein RZS08_55505, partial [Arthrospira platensis SPKY1]|nr:hypothetical protein [Arthrospira platensis SPKY1]